MTDTPTMDNSYHDIVVNSNFLLFSFVFSFVSYVITAFLMGRIFKKADIEQWRAWVPIYNSWTFLELGGQKGWFALLLLANIVPIVGLAASLVAIVFMSIAAYNIGLGFNKTGVWVVLYIIIPVVWFAILAFDSSKWQGVPQPYRSPNNYPSY